MELGVRTGLAALALAYLAYITGILRPHVSIECIVANWHRPAQELTVSCKLYTGWSWLLAFREGDYLSLILIAGLASVTGWCVVRLMPFLVRERDVPMFLVALAQLAVLILAASGWVSGA